ncbi:MAG: hypothetical protein LBI43_04790 [Streptococcaceae bacterium]|nr:hypothetical protein [Streptococcaceae bacterium]
MIWKDDRGAHIVNMERINGDLTIVDSQNNIVAEIRNYFKENPAKPSTICYRRIDNLQFNSSIADRIIKRRGKTWIAK